MNRLKKWFTEFTFREYLAWTSEEDNDEFIELDQFAGEIYNNLDIPWENGWEAVLEYVQSTPGAFGVDGEDMLTELHDEYQEMMQNPDDDEEYYIEMEDRRIISVYTKDGDDFF